VAFLVEDLIESAKDRSFAPISQSTFQDADVLRILNEELSLGMVSKIQKQREDFFIARQTTALIANKDHYLLPKRAVGNALKALFITDTSGNKRLLTRREIDRIAEYSTSAGESSEFYFEGDQVVLMHPPASGGASLLFVFSRRPNKLVLTTSCAKITAVSSSLGVTTLTVDTDLTASLSVGSAVDFLRQDSPFTLWADTVSITAITASTIAVATTDVSDVDSSVEPSVGDYICPSGYSNIPMIPEEFHPVLAEMGACRMLRALGDLNKFQAASAVLKQMMDEALDLIKNRAESSPQRPSKKHGLIRNFRA
jgi:hypothetical protein